MRQVLGREDVILIVEAPLPMGRVGLGIRPRERARR
jgi:hypothetical protein